ncbi:major facilitator superfamily-like protein [Aureococcus anophagefferens]|nr:major facilitator superfamily-like protein [Aureococcus anophagefferens]
MIEATDHYLRVPTTIEPDFADRTVRAKWRSLHKNCKLIAIYGFLFHAGWSTWERNVFPVFLDESMGRRSVGFVQSLQGLVALAAAPAFGTWFDRSESVRGARNFTVAVGVVALAAVLGALRRPFDSDGANAAATYGALGLWGLLLSAQGIFTDSVLASSAARGPERQFAFVAKSTLWRLGNVAGQAANLAFFAVAGDDWALGGLRKIMAVGVVLCLSVALLAAVRDPPPEEPDLSRPLLRGARCAAASLVPRPRSSSSAPSCSASSARARRCGAASAPSFPSPLGTLTAQVHPRPERRRALACDALARAVGRAPTMVLVRLIEPAALAALALSGDVRVSGGAFLCYLGVPVGTRAIEKAVLMDHTAKKSRGRWNAVESVNRGTWAGSAAIGAFLVHDCGYGAAFLLSAAFTGASVVVLSGLLVALRGERARLHLRTSPGLARPGSLRRLT